MGTHGIAIVINPT